LKTKSPAVLPSDDHLRLRQQFVSGRRKRPSRLPFAQIAPLTSPGVQKIVDTTGRLVRFSKKFGLDKKDGNAHEKRRADTLRFIYLPFRSTFIF
jgi:hypothetical protein